MYEAFYGLSAKPFQLNPDPSFYFASKIARLKVKFQSNWVAAFVI